MLKSVQAARITGPGTKITILGVTTEYSPKHVDLDRLEEELKYALSLLDPDNAANPYDGRPGTTEQVRV